MQELVLFGVPYDQWMNISACAGIFTLFLAYWLEVKGFVMTTALPLRMTKILGCCFISIPLFSRWFLSESLLLITGVVMTLVSASIIFLRRRGI